MEKSEMKFGPEDYRQHLQMQQDIINRMAANSSNCKLWCITINAALLALMSSHNNISVLTIVAAIAMCFVFCGLDAYYLMLERGHRKQEEKFVDGLSNGNNVENQVYKFHVQDEQRTPCKWLSALLSPSCWLFYVAWLIFWFAIGFIAAVK